MPSHNPLFLLAIGLVAVASMVVAAISWYRVRSLSLPLPMYLPALNVLFTAVAVTVVPISRRLGTKIQIGKHIRRRLLRTFVIAPTLALYALLILSLVYASPSDLQSCAADQYWLRIFESKNEIAVRRIQSRLRCCGYNSMRDRAWPFPSRNVDARTCERTQGYYIACGGLWRQEQQVAAVLCAIASFFNWLLMVICHVLHEMGQRRSLTSGRCC